MCGFAEFIGYATGDFDIFATDRADETNFAVDHFGLLERGR